MAADGKETLLARWSRLKRETANKETADRGAQAPGDGGERNRPETAASKDNADRSRPVDESAPQLPRLEELGPDSDFGVFMDPRVDEDTRRAALKTLFRSPGFNVTDGLDVYAEDYSKLEKLTPVMVAALRYAQRTLFDGNNRAERADGDSVAAARQTAPPVTTESDGAAADQEIGTGGPPRQQVARGEPMPAKTTGENMNEQARQTDQTPAPSPQQKT